MKRKKSRDKNQNHERDKEGEIFSKGLRRTKEGEVDEEGMRMRAREGESEK